jgi:hypothetical protein
MLWWDDGGSQSSGFSFNVGDVAFCFALAYPVLNVGRARHKLFGLAPRSPLDNESL